MSIRKRGKHWMYDFQHKGERFREVLLLAQSKWDAEQAEARAKQDVLHGRYKRQAPSKRFSEYAEKVFLKWSEDNKRSYKTDKYHVAALVKFFGDKTLSEITPMLIERYKKTRRLTKRKDDTERAVSSVNRELACLSKIFSLAMRDGYAASNPCVQVKKFPEPPSRDRYLSEDEERRLLAQCVGEREHLGPILIMALNTGMRRGEIFSLQRRDVDLAQSRLRVRFSKSGKDRYIPVNDAVRKILEPLCQGKDESAYLFSSPKARFEGQRLVSVKTALAGACSDAGITGFHFHDCRHTFATRLAAAGVDAFTLAELLGHADLRMTKRYTHVIEERKREAVTSLDQSPVVKFEKKRGKK